MTRRVRQAALGAVLSLSLALGCTTALDRAQAGTTAAARVVHAVDLDVAVRYASAAEDALRDAMSLSQYRENMEGWDRVELALRLTKAGLLSLQVVLDVWDATGEDPGFMRAVACFVSEVRDLIRVIQAVAPDFDLSKLQAVAPLLEAFAGGACHE